MNVSSNLTHCELTDTCWKDDGKLVTYATVDILNKLLVLITNGGTTIMFYIHRYDLLDIPSNIFIACLTFGDLFSVLALPFIIPTCYLSHNWGWTVSCFLTLWANMASAFMNAASLCVIAVDRLIYVIYPLRYHKIMTVSRATIIVHSIWISCCLYSLVTICIGYSDAYDLGTIARPCHSYFSIQGFSRHLLFYPLLGFVPITIGSYIKVGLVALRQRNAVAAQENAQAQQPGIDFRITKVMFNILSIYLVCNLIIIITPLVLRHMNLDKETREISFKVQTYIWQMNTWLNPLIYAYKSEKFRRYVRAIFNQNQVHAINVAYIM